MTHEEKERWLTAFMIAISIATLLSVYLFLRRGYYNTYIINKVVGSTAAILAGLTLLIGPLASRSIRIALLIPIRRHVGLLALGFGLAHAATSILFLSQRFPLAWYQKQWLPVLFGGAAIVLWLYLASISTNASIKHLGGTWKKHQRLFGYLAFLAAYLHLVIMKYGGWVTWLQEKTQKTPELANPSYPPASIFILLVMTGIIIYRVRRGLLAKPQPTRKYV